MSKVSVIRTGPGSVLDDYGKAMDLAGVEEAVSRDGGTVIKLNLSWTLFYPACSTPPLAAGGGPEEPEGEGVRRSRRR